MVVSYRLSRTCRCSDPFGPASKVAVGRASWRRNSGPDAGATADTLRVPLQARAGWGHCPAANRSVRCSGFRPADPFPGGERRGSRRRLWVQHTPIESPCHLRRLIIVARLVNFENALTEEAALEPRRDAPHHAAARDPPDYSPVDHRGTAGRVHPLDYFLALALLSLLARSRPSQRSFTASCASPPPCPCPSPPPR